MQNCNTIGSQLKIYSYELLTCAILRVNSLQRVNYSYHNQYSYKKRLLMPIISGFCLRCMLLNFNHLGPVFSECTEDDVLWCFWCLFFLFASRFNCFLLEIVYRWSRSGSSWKWHKRTSTGLNNYKYRYKLYFQGLQRNHDNINLAIILVGTGACVSVVLIVRENPERNHLSDLATTQLLGVDTRRYAHICASQKPILL